MSRKTESPWTCKICRQMELAGALVQAIVGARMSPAGWPDRWASWAAGPYRLAWRGHLEFKYAEGELTVLQRLRLREINRRCPRTGLVVRLCSDGVTVIEDENGHWLADFDGTGPGLMRVVGELYHVVGIDEAPSE